MAIDDASTLQRLLEFERTFEQVYYRKMTDRERQSLEHAKRVMRERLKPSSQSPPQDQPPAD